jgi:hypothetical protein
MQSNLKNITYSGSDVTIMSKIATITTKPLKIRRGLVADSSTFDIVEITKDSTGKKVYVCNFWYATNEPYFVLESQVLSIVNFI